MARQNYGDKPHILYKGRKYTLNGLYEHIDCKVGYQTLRKNIIAMKYALRCKYERKLKIQGKVVPQEIKIVLNDKYLDICMDKLCQQYIDEDINKTVKKWGKVVKKAYIDKSMINDLCTWNVSTTI